MCCMLGRLSTAPTLSPSPIQQTEMRRLESVVHTIHMELQNIRRKEERMRDVNGAQRCTVAAALLLAAVLLVW